MKQKNPYNDEVSCKDFQIGLLHLITNFLMPFYLIFNTQFDKFLSVIVNNSLISGLLESPMMSS